MILYCMGTSCQLGTASRYATPACRVSEAGFLSSRPRCSVIPPLSFPPRGLLFNPRGVFPEPFFSRRGVLSAKAGIHSLILSFMHRRESTSPSWALDLPADPIPKDPQESLVRLCPR